MTNIQLYQKFVDDKVFDKTLNLSLGCIVTFVKMHRLLTETEKENVCFAVDRISEYREMEKQIPDNQLNNNTYGQEDHGS